MNELLAGSTSSLSYIPKDATGATFASEPMLDSFALLDAAGDAVAVAATPTWDTADVPDGWVVTIAADEVPVSAADEQWTAVWTWTDTEGTKTRHEVFLTVGRYLNGHLCTFADVKGDTGIPDDQDDAKLERFIGAISETIREHCGLAFTCPPITSQRTYCLFDDPTVFVRECLSVTSVKDLAGNAVAFTAIPGDGPHLRWLELGSRFRGYVVVEGEFGWSDIPAPVRQACALTAGMVYKRDIAGDRSDTPYGRLNILPQQAIDLLAPYRTMRL